MKELDYQYKSRFERTFGEGARPAQGLYAFQLIENIVQGIKTLINRYNPATNDGQRVTNKTANAVTDFLVAMCRDVEKMFDAMAKKGQTDCAGLLKLTLQSYSPITYGSCNTTSLEQAKARQIEALRDLVCTQTTRAANLKQQMSVLETVKAQTVVPMAALLRELSAQTS